MLKRTLFAIALLAGSCLTARAQSNFCISVPVIATNNFIPQPYPTNFFVPQPFGTSVFVNVASSNSIVPGPSNLAFTNVTPTSAVATWQDNGAYSNILFFFNGPGLGPAGEMLAMPGTATAFTNNNLDPSSTYTAAIAAVDYDLTAVFSMGAGSTFTEQIIGGAATNAWIADAAFVTGGKIDTEPGAVNTTAVTNGPPNFNTQRIGNFTETIPNLTPGASYTVHLYYAELWFGTSSASGAPGDREFNVTINGTQVLTNFDIYATAGGALKAIERDFPATASATGQVTVQFATVVNNSALNALAITQP